MRWLARAAYALVLVVTVALGAVGAAGWYYSDEVLVPPEPQEPEDDVAVLALPTDDQITLTRTPETERQGLFGLELEDGYLQIEDVLDTGPDGVTRRARVVDGTVMEGDRGVVEDVAYPRDPDLAFDFELDTVSLSSEVGALPAYLDDLGSSTWVIQVHGRTTTRQQGFRLLPALHGAGISSLTISYRNDSDIEVGDGRYGLGSTEWRDLEAAVRYALDSGAEDVVLVGYSMGAAICGQLLLESDLADRVAGAVYDSPVLDWGPVLELGAEREGAPEALVGVAMSIIELRTPVDFAQLNQIARADELEVPLLVFHGVADDFVPIAQSRALAAARPDLVELVETPGALHVESFNLMPAVYGERVTEFIARVGG